MNVFKYDKVGCMVTGQDLYLTGRVAFITGVVQEEPYLCQNSSLSKVDLQEVR